MPPAAALCPEPTTPPTRRSCCSWCGSSIGSAAASTEEATPNFGICPVCLEAQLAELGAHKPSAQFVRHASPAASVASGASAAASGARLRATR